MNMRQSVHCELGRDTGNQLASIIITVVNGFRLLEAVSVRTEQTVITTLSLVSMVVRQLICQTLDWTYITCDV
jgi:hypothetical protein